MLSDKPTPLSLLISGRKKVKPGSHWLHKKGGHYVVKDLAFHTETQTLMVIYTSVTSSEIIFVRPLEMWTPDRFTEIDYGNR